MKLADLRKLSVRQSLKIRFQLANGLECVITEHGVALVPELRRTPDFNLEQELVTVREFVLEPAGAVRSADRRGVPASRRVGREELASMAIPVSTTAGGDREED